MRTLKRLRLSNVNGGARGFSLVLRERGPSLVNLWPEADRPVFTVGSWSTFANSALTRPPRPPILPYTKALPTRPWISSEALTHFGDHFAEA
jgi:hypothetical protein